MELHKHLTLNLQISFNLRKFSMVLYNLSQEVRPSQRKNRQIFFGASMEVTFVFMIINTVSIGFGLTRDDAFIANVENLTVIFIEALVLFMGYTVIYRHREKLMEITEKLRQNYPDDAWNQHVFQVSGYLKVLRILLRIMKFIYMTLMIQFVSMPGLLKLYGFVFSKEIELQMIIKLSMPFDPIEPIPYTIFTFLNVWSFFIAPFLTLMTDMLFAENIAILSMEFDILGHLISEIDPLEGQSEAFDELKRYTEVHKELIKMTEQLEDIFSPLLFIDCFGIIVVICCVAFLTLSGISKYFLAKYVLTLTAAVWTAFSHCFYGDRLIDASLSVTDGAYNCNWYDGSIKFQKLIQIIMVRGQKQQKLTGMNFLEISLETFKWMVNASYSYYSVLVARYES